MSVEKTKIMAKMNLNFILFQEDNFLEEDLGIFTEVI